MKLNASFRHDDGAVLFEIPELRWTNSEARCASERVSNAPIDILTAVSEPETWVYVPPHCLKNVEDLSEATAFLAAMMGIGTEATPKFRCRRLSSLLSIGDAEARVRQPWHYTSQTDIPAETEDEFNQWFDEEHLPQLAALSGTVHAARYRADDTPHYLAAYDLTHQEVHGSEAWRTAITTPWRDRIHHRFVNSRRLMFRRLNV
ncbi:DUF4286 family protein [Brevibacterium linens]|uniref:Uncharacterized protein n=1 Tax=Brevibacterium linens TaxID=1703 RepID=A0A2H1KGE2_BRELN|nr:DUF4286 family protein [Brevibacterium linens]SMX98833.1 hypothetical protein BLIN101_03326 [Brevibacterium linens]